jgi:hypothetical protein
MGNDTSRLFARTMPAWGLVLTAAFACAPSAHAATANIYASATIVPPVGVTGRDDMAFSSFVAGTTPGTITLLVPSDLSNEPTAIAGRAKSGGRRPAGGVRLVGGTTCSALTPCGVGGVQIGGPASASISGVTTQTTTTLTSGDSTMTLERVALRYGADGTAGAVTGPSVLSVAGHGRIVIGGVLNVAARQAAGQYSGSLLVALDY